MTSTLPPVLVIGLDGASFRVLDPLIAHGVMPHLAALMKRGTQHTMISTLPTNSVAAWTSFQTGKNPGKHGIFTFIDHAQDNFAGRMPVNKRAVADRYFWEIAAQHGRRVAIINTPMTYPPPETNGVVIAGLMTPRSKGIVGTPQPLIERMLAAVPGYRLDVMWGTYGSDNDRLLADLRTAVAARTEAALWLMAQDDFNLVQVVYTVMDRLQHALWNDLMTAATNEGVNTSRSSYSEALLDIFREIDAGIGQLVGAAGPDATIFVASDHGFGPTSVQFMAGEWLATHGYFAERRGVLRRIISVLASQTWLVRRVRSHFAQTARRVYGRTQSGAVVWSRSRAYPKLKGEHSGISLNVIGREPHGVVASKDLKSVRDELIAVLEAERIPGTSQPLFARVYRRDELLHGRYEDAAPDILLESASGVATSFNRKGRLLGPPQAEGNHTRGGILIAAGPGIQMSDKRGVANIVDLAPTFLYQLGLSVPDDMDGTILLSVFTEAHRNKHDVKTHPVSDAYGPGRSGGYTPEEQAEVERRLHDLGYL